MEQLLSLAKDGLGFTLFVIAALVNVYQYRLNNELQNKRLEDWRTALNLANNLASANQKMQEAAGIMQTGFEIKLQRIMDKLGIV